MESPVLRKHRTYPTQEQKARLFELVQADQELNRGLWSETFTKREAARRWQVIADELNSMYGAIKTWNEWRKNWQDKKSRDKKEGRANNTLKAERVNKIKQEKLPTNNSVPESSERGPSKTENPGLIIKDVFQPGAAMKMELESSDSDDPLNFQDMSSDPETPEPEPELEIEVPIINPGKSPSRKKPYRRVLRRPMTQPRLDATNHIAVNEVKKALIEKNKIKKQFYAEYMVEIRKQTQALIAIAKRLAKR